MRVEIDGKVKEVRIDGEVQYKYRKYLDYIEHVLSVLNRNIALVTITTDQFMFQLMSDNQTYNIYNESLDLKLTTNDDFTTYYLSSINNTNLNIHDSKL